MVCQILSNSKRYLLLEICKLDTDLERDFLNATEPFNSIHPDSVDLIKLLASIVKSSKKSIENG
jgi:hypothetical protein